jgi:hypothetical protein
MKRMGKGRPESENRSNTRETMFKSLGGYLKKASLMAAAGREREVLKPRTHCIGGRKIFALVIATHIDTRTHTHTRRQEGIQDDPRAKLTVAVLLQSREACGYGLLLQPSREGEPCAPTRSFVSRSSQAKATASFGCSMPAVSTTLLRSIPTGA